MFERTVRQGPGGRQLIEARRRDGLAVDFVLLPGFVRRFLALLVPFGSFQSRFIVDGRERTARPGAAHFLEHLLFQDSEEGLLQRFASLGVRINAYTSHTHTLYYLHARDDLGLPLRMLLNAVNRPLFDEAAVERERAIIGAEIEMTNNDPESLAWKHLLSASYPLHPLGQDIAGSLESVAAFSHEELLALHDAWYRPAGFRLTLAGDFAEQEIVDLLRQVQELVPEGRAATRPLAVVDPVQEARVRSEVRENVELPRFLMTVKGDAAALPQGREARLAAEISLAFQLDASLSPLSPQFDELVSRGLISEGLGTQLIVADDVLCLIVGGASEHPEEAADAVLQVLTGLQQDGVSESRFRIAARAAEGRLRRRLDSVPGSGRLQARTGQRGIDLFSLFSLYAKISVPQAGAPSYGLFDADRSRTLIVRPIE